MFDNLHRPAVAQHFVYLGIADHPFVPVGNRRTVISESRKRAGAQISALYHINPSIGLAGHVFQKGMKRHRRAISPQLPPAIFETAGLRPLYVVFSDALSDNATAENIVPIRDSGNTSHLVLHDKHNGPVSLHNERIAEIRIWR